MSCQYCGSPNGSDDHRCGRCGRYLNDAPGRPEMFPVQDSAAARALNYDKTPAVSPPSRPQLVTELPTAPIAGAPAHQASLFGPQVVTGAPSAASLKKPGVGLRRGSSDPPPQRHPKEPNEGGAQRSFEYGLGEAARPLAGSAQAIVYGNAEVAKTPHRLVAAGIDFALCLFFATAFFAAAYLVAGQVVLTKSAYIAYGLSVALVALLYRLLYCLGCCDTPGVQLAGLQLINFDGRKPTRRQRLGRTAGGMLSAIAAGIGLLWALVDEERLTWHDHISKTYPVSR